MSIRFDEKNQVFHLNTPNTTYLFGLYHGKVPVHLYYGNKITGDFAIEDVFTPLVHGFSPICDGIAQNDMPLEYPCYGSPDFRIPAFHARY